VTPVTELVPHVSTSSSVFTLAQCYLSGLLVTMGWHIISSCWRTPPYRDSMLNNWSQGQKIVVH